MSNICRLGQWSFIPLSSKSGACWGPLQAFGVRYTRSDAVYMAFPMCGGLRPPTASVEARTPILLDEAEAREVTACNPDLRGL